MSSSVGTESESNEPTAGASTTVESKRQPSSKYDAEFLHFIQNGRFEDDDPDLSEPLDENTPDRFNVKEHNYGQVIKTINETFEKSTIFKNAEKERLKRAVVEVMVHRKSRCAVVKDLKLNCINFLTVLSNIYRRLNLTPSGAKRRTYPQYEMNLLEIRIDEFDQEDGEAKKRKADGEPEVENGEVRPTTKKIKKSAGSGFGKTPLSSTSKKNTQSHATLTRRLGDAVPAHWKEHVDLTKFCIRKSVDLTLARGERNDVNSTLNKCNAIETIILQNGNCKNAAASNNLNYSTLHNYTHRAMVTIQKVLGDERIPDQTAELMAEDATYEEICRKMGVRRAPTLARFVPKRSVGAADQSATTSEKKKS